MAASRCCACGNGDRDDAALLALVRCALRQPGSPGCRADDRAPSAVVTAGRAAFAWRAAVGALYDDDPLDAPPPGTGRQGIDAAPDRG